MGRTPRPWNYGERIDAIAEQSKVDRGEPLAWQPERKPVAFQVFALRLRKPWGEIIREPRGWCKGMYRVVFRSIGRWSKRVYGGVFHNKINAQASLQSEMRRQWALYRELMQDHEDSQRKADEAAAGIAVRRQRDRQEHTSR